MKKIPIWLGAFFAIVLCCQSMQAQAVAFDPEEGYKNLNIRFYEDEKPDEGFYVNASARYILETVKAPSMGSTYGEWSVMDLLRGMYTGYDYVEHIPSTYFTQYKSRIDKYVKGVNCQLDASKSTEWSRLSLTMTALGYPLSNINGCNFIDQLSQSYAFSYRQGINGPIWELIAMDTGNYDFLTKPSVYTAGDINTKGRLIDYILKHETEAGGWTLFGTEADPDITGMALQALAPYYLSESRYKATNATKSYTEFKKYVERGVQKLSTLQYENGGYNAWGNVNAESTVQVIVALTALNIDPKAKQVTLPTLKKTVSFNQQGATRDGVYTDNMVDALLTFFAPGSGSSPEVGGFKHVTAGYDGGGGSGSSVNAMATDQALYGLIAYDRFVQRKNRLYDMTDMKDGQYKSMKAKTYTVTFKNGDATETATYAPYAIVDLATPFANSHVIAWTTSEDDAKTTQYTTSEKLVMPKENITLYAKTDVKSYEITYELDGGTVQQAPTTFNDMESTALPTAANVQKAGYQFAGWYTTPDFSSNAVTTIPKNTTTPQTFYAKWIAQDAVSIELTTLIQQLPTRITMQDIEFVKNARAMYNSLTKEEQATILNVGKLLDAEQQVITLQNEANTDDSEKVTNDAVSVMYIIQQLPLTVTLQTQSDIENARAAYNSLSIAQKRQVTNYALLVRSEKQYTTLTAKEVDAANAKRVTQQIAALPAVKNVKLTSKETIAAARVAYDTLLFSQQELVTNYNKLLQVEVQLQKLEKANRLTVSAVKNTHKVVTGHTTANQLVKVYRGKTLLGSKKAGPTGDYKVSIAKQKADLTLKVVAGKYSKSVVVKTSKTLKKPTVSATKVTTVTGKSTKGYRVEVYNGTKRIGTATVNKKNAFTVKIVKQKKKQKLKIRVIDSMNNKSGYKMIQVK